MLTIALATLAAAAPPPASASCTDQYRRKTHVSQAAAKAFGRACLVEMGAKPRQTTPAEVDQVLTSVIPDDDPLTAVVPADIGTFCPGYTKLAAPDRARFWRRLMSAMVPPESGYNTAALLWEKGNPGEYSVGLLQLSLSNEGSYHCGMKSEVDLTDAAFNLRCGAMVMRKRVNATKAGEQPRIGGDRDYLTRFAATYWSTLRDRASAPPGAPPVGARAAIIKATRASPGCEN